MNKHPAFPVSLIKRYRSSDKELYPLRNKPPLEIPPLEEGEEKKIVKVVKERRTRNKTEREYLVRYRNSTPEDEWLVEKDITNADKLLWYSIPFFFTRLKLIAVNPAYRQTYTQILHQKVNSTERSWI
ncbi:hypothetical protein O181_088739 [Austropuccinia psidii MF-1]|uniref:Chromo domain-containing protein n=1 Tax=Austropuccinia psidii MF-1 TaxID=1389203 RepID=A0A9Q3ISA9_9BASI|nr:hypothetical protein [Austropuccinia psidii MF-1]